jgi:hypothetical protein
LILRTHGIRKPGRDHPHCRRALQQAREKVPETRFCPGVYTGTEEVDAMRFWFRAKTDSHEQNAQTLYLLQLLDIFSLKIDYSITCDIVIVNKAAVNKFNNIKQI